MADAAGIFSGLATTPVILAQNNIQNFGKNSTGNYSGTYATALASADYIPKGMAKSAGASFTVVFTALSTTGFSVMVFGHDGVAIDPAELRLEFDLV